MLSKLPKISIIFALLLFLYSCKDDSGIPASLEIKIIDGAISSGISRIYTSNDTDTFFTPDSYVIKIASVVVGDGSGNLTEILDFENDAECIALDIGAGEKLSDIISNDFEFQSEQVYWLILATLPGIDFSYLDTNGVRHNGSFENAANTTDNGSWAHYYGGARGRNAQDLSFTKPDMGWDGTNPSLTGTNATVNLFFDLSDIIEDSNEDGNYTAFGYEDSLIPVTDSCSIEYYYLKKSGTAGDIYPFQIRIVKSEEGKPLFHSIKARNFDPTGESEFQIPELEGIGGINSDCPRDEVVTINSDGSLNLILPSGDTIQNLKSADYQTITIGASSVDIKMIKKY